MNPFTPHHPPTRDPSLIGIPIIGNDLSMRLGVVDIPLMREDGEETTTEVCYSFVELSKQRKELGKLIERAWPELDSRLIYPSELLWVHIMNTITDLKANPRKYFDRINGNPQTPTLSDAKNKLETIRAEINRAFGNWDFAVKNSDSLNPEAEESKKIMIEASKDATKITLKKVIDMLRACFYQSKEVKQLAEDIQTICFVLTHSDNSLLSQPMGQSRDIKKHMHFFDIYINMIENAIKRRLWEEFPRPRHPEVRFFYDSMKKEIDNSVAVAKEEISAYRSYLKELSSKNYKPTTPPPIFSKNNYKLHEIYGNYTRFKYEVYDRPEIDAEIQTGMKDIESLYLSSFFVLFVCQNYLKDSVHDLLYEKLLKNDLSLSEILRLRTHLFNVHKQTTELLEGTHFVSTIPSNVKLKQTIENTQIALKQILDETASIKKLINTSATDVKEDTQTLNAKSILTIKLLHGVKEVNAILKEGIKAIASTQEEDIESMDKEESFALTHIQRLLTFAIDGATHIIESWHESPIFTTPQESKTGEVEKVDAKEILFKDFQTQKKPRLTPARRGGRKKGKKGKRAKNKRKVPAKRAPKKSKQKAPSAPTVKEPIVYHLDEQVGKSGLRFIETTLPKTYPTAKEEKKADFLSCLSTKNWKDKPHSECFYLHMKRLKFLRAALLDVQETEKYMPIHRKKRLLFLQISRCQQLLESVLKSALASFDIKANGKQHILDSVTYNGQPLRFMHSSHLLAASLIGATGSDERLKRVQNAIENHMHLIQNLDAAHSLVYYLERGKETHPSRNDPGSKRLIPLLVDLKRAKTPKEIEVCESEVEDILRYTLQCAYEILEGLKAAATESDFKISEEVKKLLNVPTDKKGKENLESIELEDLEVTPIPLPETRENILPSITDKKSALLRIKHCREILSALKFFPAAGDIQKSLREKRRNETLSHIEGYLESIENVLTAKDPTCHPFALTLPALDAIHRAIKEAIVAAFYHYPAYDEERKHRLLLPAKPGVNKMLLVENNVSLTYSTLVDYLKSEGHERILGGLPTNLTEHLPWLNQIHDRLNYPTLFRKTADENRVYKITSSLYRQGHKLRKLADAGIDDDWKMESEDKTLDPKVIKDKLDNDTEALMQEAIFPGLNALYLLIRGSFE